VLDLRQALQETEMFCTELRNKYSHLQSEVSLRDTDILTLKDQLDNSRKHISTMELQMEKMNSTVSRLKSDKDSYERIRESLERELEFSRTELTSKKMLARPGTVGIL
jgi:chromosome segregation ATPase